MRDDSGLLHGHRDLVLLLQLGDGFVVLVLLLLQCRDRGVAPLDLLVNELHALAHVLAALLQLLAHQHRSVEFEDLPEDFVSEYIEVMLQSEFSKQFSSRCRWCKDRLVSEWVEGYKK